MGDPAPYQCTGYQRLLLAWPDPEIGPFVIEAHWALEGDVPVCVGLEIWKGVIPEPDRIGYEILKGTRRLEGIGSLDLRSLPLVSIIDQLWAMQGEQWQVHHDQLTGFLTDPRFSEGTRGDIEVLLESNSRFESTFSGDRKRRKPDDVEHFERVAEVYRAALNVPGRRRPTLAVSQHFGVSYSTATKWVMRARELKLLPKTEPGRPSAAMKPKKKARKS